MALDRLLAHGMLTLITIFCCSNVRRRSRTKKENAISARVSGWTETELTGRRELLTFIACSCSLQVQRFPTFRYNR
jgi:hypothetical protein